MVVATGGEQVFVEGCTGTGVRISQDIGNLCCGIDAALIIGVVSVGVVEVARIARTFLLCIGFADIASQRDVIYFLVIQIVFVVSSHVCISLDNSRGKVTVFYIQL